MQIKKNDTVVVIAGKDKGKTGTVLRTLPKTNKVVVEGVNMIKKHTKPSASNPQGGIVEKEASIHISNLMLVDAKGVASRIGRHADENGKLVRYSKKTGEDIR